MGLQVAAVSVPFLQIALHTVPLGSSDWGSIPLFARPVFILPELWKGRALSQESPLTRFVALRHMIRERGRPNAAPKRHRS